VVEGDTQDAALDLAESTPGHTGVSVLIDAGQVEPKPGKEKSE